MPSVVEIFIFSGMAVSAAVGVTGISVETFVGTAVAAACGISVAEAAVGVDWQAVTRSSMRKKKIFFFILDQSLNEFNGVLCLVFKEIWVDAIGFFPRFERAGIIAFAV